MPRSPRPADQSESGRGSDGGTAAESDPDFTVDALLGGRVTLIQPRRGFRSSLDPVLLARFLAPPFGRFLDIGCGTGALSFSLLAGDARATGAGVELQPRLARLAALGRERNGVGERFTLIEGDVRAAATVASFGSESFDLVATNPPFRAVERGQSSPDGERAVANHELTLTLVEWLDIARRLVKVGGRVGVVYAAERLPELLTGFGERDLTPVRLRAVHPFVDRAALRVLVEAQRDSRRLLVIEPPLILHEGEPPRFTDETKSLLG
jgi:tRNA1Val (adenine37-N6)-methyltransferase